MAIGRKKKTGYERFDEEEWNDNDDSFGGGLLNRILPKMILDKLCWRRPPETTRVVHVDGRSLPNEGHVHVPYKYTRNVVVSSKYTILTFLPKNLFEQFRRIANFYFLCMAIIMLSIDTPVTPVTTILPLVFVISVTAIKQGYEDWLRHKADKEVNMRPTVIVKNGEAHKGVRSMDIEVGNIVKVKTNEEFPCDMILLSSADEQGLCYVTTANLDGETNLKTHFCVNETKMLRHPEDFKDIQVRITCKPPIADLYTFEGVIEFGDNRESKPLSSENLLLRGARLKNTPYIYGCALFTGRQTKMALNSKFKQNKFSRVERKMNSFLIVFLAFLLTELITFTALKYWYENKYGVPYYVPANTSSQDTALKVLENALAFMVLFNYIIPISLYVTVELQKFLGSLFFGYDVEMYDETIEERALANTSDLNEELGQVEYLFTDKTGTLTENMMSFRRCCVGSYQFEDIHGTLCLRTHPELSPEPVKDLQVIDQFIPFLTVLALCHTVRVDYKDSVDSTTYSSSDHRTSVVSEGSEETSGIEYQASSPDEKALVEACYRYGVIFLGTFNDRMEVTFSGHKQSYQLLHVLPFDATRKRMSVIVKDEKGKILLLCKGAEMAILDRVKTGDVVTTQRMVDQYAVLGLRTLTIAQRVFTELEYKQIDKELMDAKKALDRREERLAEQYNILENDLDLLGATAVEDKLQDQVPETIMALREAGIKVWVLTGDKEETAVNISHSAGHFHPGMMELRLTQIKTYEQCAEQIDHFMNVIQNRGLEEHALIVDGASLKHALKLSPERFRKLCSMCVAVLCCRMSPIQKAEVVALIKDSPEKPVTAAIGDGANDVSMIQEAAVGLGIMGKEGRQAVRNSDYAFGKFKFLHRALLFHGHLYYNRVAILVQYFFYKNIAFVTGQVIYAALSAFSQQSLYDPFFLVMYNITFTSLPILIYGLFEQHRTSEDLISRPELYRDVTRNALLTPKQFLIWMLFGLWHCGIVFFGVVFLRWNGVSIFKSGYDVSNYDFGTIIIYTVAIVVNLKLLLETYYWCWPIIGAYLFSIVGNICMSILYAAVFWPPQGIKMIKGKDFSIVPSDKPFFGADTSWVVDQNAFYGVLGQIVTSGALWLGVIIICVIALLPDFCYKAMKDFRWSVRKQKWENRGITLSTGRMRSGTKESIATIVHSHQPSTSLGLTSKAQLVDNIELHGSQPSVRSDSGRFAYDNPIPVVDSPTDKTAPIPKPQPSPQPSRKSGEITVIQEIHHPPSPPPPTVVAEARKADNVDNVTTPKHQQKEEKVIIESSHL